MRKHRSAIEQASQDSLELGIGGTATGTGLNSHPSYRKEMVRELRQALAMEFRMADDYFEAMQSLRPMVSLSHAVRNLSQDLCRIANDLRLMGSGPTTGLAEISLPAVQPGSSIMPGKVNPSMLECMNQVCFHVLGGATAIDYALQAGQLELNVMMPMMAFEILFSIDILKNYIPVFVRKCVAGIEADRERCEAYYITSPALATALNPIIGYAKAAEVSKEAVKSKEPIPQLLRKKKMLSEGEIGRIFTPAFLAGQADRKK